MGRRGQALTTPRWAVHGIVASRLPEKRLLQLTRGQPNPAFHGRGGNPYHRHLRRRIANPPPGTLRHHGRRSSRGTRARSALLRSRR